MNLLYNSGIVLHCKGNVMNDWDRNNLHFILDSDEATLDDFYSWATEDDLVYALSLVREARAELLVQEAELMDEVEDLSSARDVLRQFQL
jgi:hypothetical protein